MNCHHIQKRLSAYQDGEIAGEERKRIAAHLEGCPACRSTYAELEQVWQSLENIPEIEISAGFERTAVRTDQHRSRAPFAVALPLGFLDLSDLSAPAMAVVLLLVGAVLGGYLGNAVISGFSSAPAQEQALRTDTDIVSFRVFSAAPPGTLGDGYLRMVHFTEEDRK